MTSRKRVDEIIGESGGAVEAVGGMTFNGEQFHLSIMDVTIDEGDVATLDATPATLLGAPGADKAHILHSVEFLKEAGTAYGVADLTVQYETAANGEIAVVEGTGFMDQTTAERRFLKCHDSGTYSASSAPLGANEAIELIAAAAPGAGTGDLKVRVRYRTVDVLA